MRVGYEQCSLLVEELAGCATLDPFKGAAGRAGSSRRRRGGGWGWRWPKSLPLHTDIHLEITSSSSPILCMLYDSLCDLQVLSRVTRFIQANHKIRQRRCNVMDVCSDLPF